ncbi:hypothetical protein AAFC00_002414 [Neodothiora populina]|uniref:Protein kinase domain-containing protein n=1 Tax=Neodothiora populina TaxID=2781224 RepID=A0ABR3P7S5_9PEZI
MAEFVFGLLSLPGDIKEIIEITRWIRDRVRRFKNAPRFLQHLETYDYPLHEGQLELQLQAATAILSRSNKSVHVKLARQYIDGLAEASRKARNVLEKCVDEEGRTRRFYIALTGERKLKVVLEDLDDCLSKSRNFIVCIDIVGHMSSKTAQHLLTEDKFRMFGRHDYEPFDLGWDGFARIARGEYRKGTDADAEPTEVSVLIEEYESDDVRAEQTVNDLSRILTVSSQCSEMFGETCAILPCMGYRKTPLSNELVFRIPVELNDSSVQTLAEILANDSQKGDISTRQRLCMAHSIAAAIGILHIAQFVHKGLRPDSIMVFHMSSMDPAPIYRPFVSHWNHLRQRVATSDRTEDDEWTRKLYRHPSRQSVSSKQRYSVSHDVYSLGVILLEIGLWEPLIIWQDDEPQPASIYVRAAIALDLVSLCADWQVNNEKMLKPTNVQQIIAWLADNELTRRTAESYAAIVRLCLEDVEEQRIGNTPLKADIVELRQQYYTMVIGPLYSMTRE